MPSQRTVAIAAWILHGVRRQRWMLTTIVFPLTVNADLDSERSPWQGMLTFAVNAHLDRECGPWQWMLTTTVFPLTVNAHHYSVPPDSECWPWQWMFTSTVKAHFDSECWQWQWSSPRRPRRLCISGRYPQTHLLGGWEGFTAVTNWLAPWHTVLLQKLTFLQLFKIPLAFYGTPPPSFPNVFTKARHLSLSWARLIHSTRPLLFLMFVLILSPIYA